jgi:hypothetical protein
MEADKPTDPLDDILNDPNLIEAGGSDPDVEFEDFDIAMPKLEKASEDDPLTEEDDIGQADDNAEEKPSEASPVLHNIESEARGRKKKLSKPRKTVNPKRRKALAVMGLAASLVMLAGGGVYYRTAICAYVPAMAGLYDAIGLPVNLLGVDFAKVRLKRKYENGFPVLSVQGEVVNVSGTPRRVPDVRLGLRGPGGQEIYHWSINVGRTRLEPNERVKFVTRLASPPEEASKLVLKFDSLRQRRLGAL